MNIYPCNDATLLEGANILLNGGIVVIPTDTVYGLAAHPARHDAVKRLWTIKGREAAKPIALLASDVAAVENARFAIPDNAKDLCRRYWPGALTLVITGANGATEGFRVPAHDWTRRLIKECGGLLRVTSANPSGSMPALDAAQALESVGVLADAVFDDGPAKGGIASTVLKIDGDNLVILREGAVKKCDVFRQSKTI